MVEERLGVGKPQPEDPFASTEENYFSRAVLCLLVGSFLSPLGGIIVSIIGLRRAKRDKESGIETRYVGCLWAVLVWWAVSILLVSAALVIFQ